MNSSPGNKIVRQVIAIVVSVFLVWTIYLGSYLPWQKSKSFILTLQGMGDMHSVGELEQSFDVPFSIPSPIGQEEIVRHFSSAMLSAIQQFGPDQASTTIQIVQYVEDNFRPIIQKQRGMSFGQNLFILGSLNEVAFLQTKNPKYLTAAQDYYGLGRELAPKRPQFLYGLFDLYRLEGNVSKATEVSNEIMTLWPSDTKTKSLLDSFLSKAKSSVVTK